MKLLISSKSFPKQELQIDLGNHTNGQEFILYLNDQNQLNVIEITSGNQILLDNYFSTTSQTTSRFQLKTPLLLFKLFKQIETLIRFYKYGKTIISTPKNLVLRLEPSSLPKKLKKLLLYLNDGREIDLAFTLESYTTKKPLSTNSFSSLMSPINLKSNSKLIDYNQVKHRTRSNEDHPSMSNHSNDLCIESPVKETLSSQIIEEYKTPSNYKSQEKTDFVKFGTKSTKVSPFSGSLSEISDSKNTKMVVSNLFATPRIPKNQIKSFNIPSSKAKKLFVSSDKKVSKKFDQNIKLSEEIQNIKYIVCFSNLCKSLCFDLLDHF
jgi:hypothetical protein